MANKYYEPGDQRAAKVADLFATVATRYDWINDLQSFGLHRVWKRRLVRLAAPQPGERALDVCCGTGDIAFALAQAGAAVAGVDFCEPMLAIARRRAQEQTDRFKAGPRRRRDYVAPEFVPGDALQLPFPDQQFDIVTVGYGLRNLASWERGVEEMWRVTRPGGRVLMLDFGKPPHPLWRRIYFAYLRRIIPVIGKLFSGEAAAYSYILESLQHYPAQDGVHRKLEALGATARIEWLLGGVMTINVGRKG